MPLSVTHDDDMPFTEEHLREIRNYASFLGVEEAGCDEQLEMIRSSEESLPVIRHEDRGSRENYRLSIDGLTVGALTLKSLSDDRWEVDIIVYHEHRGNDYARIAIRSVLGAHRDRRWRASILSANPALPHLRFVLNEMGFVQGLPFSGMLSFNRDSVTERPLKPEVG